MKFNVFKSQLMALAEDESIELRKIQALITKFFKEKSIPYLQSNQTFVVRCGINDTGEVFKNVSRCSYPPDDRKLKIRIQRANYPGQQVFYCSMPSETAFASASSACVMETAWEHIEDWDVQRTYLTLSRWSIVRPLNLWILPFSDLCCIRNKDFNNIKTSMTKFIQEKHHKSDEVIEALEFISDVYCQRVAKNVYYRITSAFYNALLFFEKSMSKSYDGLIYPSANTEAAGLNIVLKRS